MDEQERIPVQSGNARERGGMGGGVAGDGGQGKTKDKSSEDILRETLTCMMPDSADINDLIAHTASDQTELDACTIFKLLVGTINVLWFDLFTALGVSHARLEEIREQYPYDPNPCLFQSILVWLAGESPKPSWKALADVLQFKMLQAELAKKIVRLHFSDKERAEEDRYLKGVPMGPIPPEFDDEDENFTTLILELVKELGGHSFPEIYLYLKQLLSASGTKFLDQSYFAEVSTSSTSSSTSSSSSDDLLMPLLDNNLISSQDVDLLLAMITGVGRENLIPLVESYCSKATLCHPVFKVVKDTTSFFSLRLELDSNVCVDLDLRRVSLIKREMCQELGVEAFPYLLQFIGWRRTPLMVQFQTHMSLVDRVLLMVQDVSRLGNYVRIDMDIRGSIFNFNIKKLNTVSDPVPDQ